MTAERSAEVETSFLPDDPDLVFEITQGKFPPKIQKLVDTEKYTEEEVRDRACYKLIFECKFRVVFVGRDEITVVEALRIGIERFLHDYGPTELAYDQAQIESMVMDKALDLWNDLKSGNIRWPPKIRV